MSEKPPKNMRLRSLCCEGLLITEGMTVTAANKADRKAVIPRSNSGSGKSPWFAAWVTEMVKTTKLAPISMLALRSAMADK